MSPINSFMAYEIECDECGSNFDGGDHIPWFKTEGDAKDYALDSDGRVWNGYVWCEGCTPNCSTCGCPFSAHGWGEEPCEEDDGCEAFTYGPKEIT